MVSSFDYLMRGLAIVLSVTLKMKTDLLTQKI
jgi:hypothetical protein